MTKAELSGLNKAALIDLVLELKETCSTEILEELQSIRLLLEDRKQEINTLRAKVEDRNDDVRELQIQVNILEQRNKKRNIIVTDVDLRSYSEVAASDDTLPGNDEAAPERPNAVSSPMKKKRFIKFALTEINHDIKEEEIADVFQLKNKKVLVKFSSTEAKLNLMAARRKMRRMDKHYINDHLTFTGGQLAKQCRDLRKAGKAKFTWTMMGKIFIKKKEDSPTIEVKCSEDIGRFINNG